MSDDAAKSAWNRVYDKLAEEGGGTWATYMMQDIDALIALSAPPTDPAPSIDAEAVEAFGNIARAILSEAPQDADYFSVFLDCEGKSWRISMDHLRAFAALRPATDTAARMEAERAVKAADDAIVSAIHAVFENGAFSHDALLAPSEVRSRVSSAIRAALTTKGTGQ